MHYEWAAPISVGQYILTSQLNTVDSNVPIASHPVSLWRETSFKVESEDEYHFPPTRKRVAADVNQTLPSMSTEYAPSE